MTTHAGGGPHRQRAGRACSTATSCLSMRHTKKIMAALQSAFVNHEAETYALLAGFARAAIRSDRSPTTRHAGSEPSAAPLRFAITDGCCAANAIQGDRTTPELMELMARLESMLPYWQAPKVLADSCPLNRLRRMRSCARYDQDRQAARRPGHAGNWRARSQTDDPWHLEMQLPGARRKEFVISIDTAYVRSADQHSARIFELVVARCARGGRGERGGCYFLTGSTDHQAIRDRALRPL